MPATTHILLNKTVCICVRTCIALRCIALRCVALHIHHTTEYVESYSWPVSGSTAACRLLSYATMAASVNPCFSLLLYMYMRLVLWFCARVDIICVSMCMYVQLISIACELVMFYGFVTMAHSLVLSIVTTYHILVDHRHCRCHCHRHHHHHHHGRCQFLDRMDCIFVGGGIS